MGDRKIQMVGTPTVTKGGDILEVFAYVWITWAYQRGKHSVTKELSMVFRFQTEMLCISMSSLN